MIKSTHINFVEAAEVAAGRKPPNTPVGRAQDDEGRWYTGFIAFDKQTGVARVSSKTGNTTINWRLQG